MSNENDKERSTEQNMEIEKSESVPLNCKPSRAKASFGIWHDELRPSEITEMLAIEPERQREKGEIRTTKSGTRVVSPTGCWIISSSRFIKTSDCNSHVDWILDQLSSSSGALRTLRKRGFRMQITCCVHVNHWNTAWQFEPDLLRKIGNLDIPLAVDVYDDVM